VGVHQRESYACNHYAKYVERKTTERDLKILPMESLREISEYCVEGHPFAIPFFIGLHAR